MRFRVLILSYLAAAGTGAAQVPPISIAGADNTQSIKVAVGSPFYSQLILVQAVDNRGAKQVTLKANPWVGPNQRWLQPQAAWWIDNKPVAPDTPQDVPGLGEKVLKITAPLAVPGKYAGTIDVIYENARHTFKIEVERSADAELTIRDKELSVDRSDVSLSTAIESKGRSAVRNVTVDVHTLIGPDARQIVPTVTVGGRSAATPIAVNIPANGQVPLVYAAALPVPGKYTGVIDLVYGLKRQPETVTITRNDAKVPVTIRPIESAQAQSWPFLADSATVRVLLEGTRADMITLGRPSIPTFALKESEKVSKSAIRGAIRIQTADESGNLTDVNGSLTLNGRKPVDLRITIPGLSPGEYSGIFSAGSADLSPVESPFTVYVRHSMFLAGLVIALSVLGSYFLRQWAISDRPRLHAQRTIAQLSADVDSTRAEVTDATPAEQRVLDSFSERLAKLFNDWAGRKPADSDVIVKEIGDKLVAFGKWVNLRRRFDHVELPLSTIRPMLARLADFGDLFLDKRVDAATVSTGIDKLRTDLSQALETAMTNAIKAIRDDLAEQKKTATGRIFSDKLDEKVEPLLKAAEELAKSDDSLALAAGALEDARLVYTQVLASGLDALLPTTTPDAQNIPQDAWDKLLTTVRSELTVVQNATDANTAAAGYARGYAAYLKKLLDAAKARLDAAPEKLDRSTLNDADKAAAQQKIDAAEQLVSDCATLLATHDVTTAAAKYEELKQRMTEIQATLTRGGQQMRAADGKAMADPPSAVQMANAPPAGANVQGFAALAPRPSRIPGTSVADLEKRIKMGEVVVALIAGILAVLLGIKLLWVPAPTWGAPSDWITAILWGFGLHQVSGAAMGQFDWATMLTKIGGGGNAQS